jgi:hypothetical protein
MRSLARGGSSEIFTGLNKEAACRLDFGPELQNAFKVRCAAGHL